MSYYDVYFLPVPVRKFLIDEYAKQIEEENKKSNKSAKSSYVPLTATEKALFKGKEKMATNSNIMTQMRNK